MADKTTGKDERSNGQHRCHITAIYARTFNLLRIRRARVMRVDLLALGALVERHEPVQEILASRVVVVTAGVVGEVVAQR